MFAHRRPPSPDCARRGVTFGEFAFLLGLFLALILCLARWGWIGGAGWLAATVAFFSVVHVLYRYHCEADFEVDSVRCATCGCVGKFDWDLQLTRGLWQCACGTQYRFRGPLLLVLDEAGEPRPYMKWKWWGKGEWRPVRTH